MWVGARDEQLCEYFEWRQGDASRCALSNTCYWTLRQEGMSARQATSMLSGATRSEKNELLFERGVNFNDLPVWQRRGVGVGWETYTKLGENPKTGEKVEVERRRLGVDEAIPMGREFGAYALTRSTGR